MGISRDNWHKRHKTQGKRKPYHKKRKYELGRPAANRSLTSASNNELVRTKTLVKNCIVLIDSTQYRQWYESHYACTAWPQEGGQADS
ncbi:40S ribosomal protein S8 [Microtus ochrogaster]|uniref:40S ribosomal protein S8 n=1 Tax=Microtus ochrogaster TaxID=79684 RepID=A0A8J6KVE0_MICOH|nr:40S ribosomal protein S8 [Microtus ochrogaster]